MQRFEKNNFISILEGKLKIAEREEEEENARQRARDEKLRKAVADIEGPSLAELEAQHKAKFGDDEEQQPENGDNDAKSQMDGNSIVANEDVENDDVYGF